jgi:hypothetical protein
MLADRCLGTEPGERGLRRLRGGHDQANVERRGRVSIATECSTYSSRQLVQQDYRLDHIGSLMPGLDRPPYANFLGDDNAWQSCGHA